MSGMTINNFGNGVSTTSELSLMQSELVKASVEYTKQYGIINQLMNELRDKKLSAIRKAYTDVSVFHKIYGVCCWNFTASCSLASISLQLKYWVKHIPTNGLSANDKKVAESYNKWNDYESAYEYSRKFKSFENAYNLVGSVCWKFSIEEVCSSDFLQKGIRYDDGNKEDMFKINLE